MVPSPPLWAVLGDVLLCLGAGLLLGAVRDGATHMNRAEQANVNLFI